MNGKILSIYKRVMSVPEGLAGAEHRRLTRKYVSGMSEGEVGNILGRIDEIEERSWDEFLLRKQILLELGFMETEAGVFARCRLNSPGIRTLIKERVEVTRYATDAEIKQINEGSRGTLRGLTILYGKGKVKNA